MPTPWSPEQRGLRGRFQRVVHFPGTALGFVRRRLPGSTEQSTSPRAAPSAVAAGGASPPQHRQPGPLDWLQQRLAPKQRDVPSALCFPTSLCHRTGLTSSGQACQDLMTVGTRLWGSWWDGRALLRVKIYEFAVYMDRQQANKSVVRRKYPALEALSAVPAHKQPELDPKFFRDLRQTEDIEMSLLVRAARPLPIKMLAGEYERILRRRMTNVGGSPDDPAVQSVVDAFREDNLPAELRDNGNVKKGTVLLFSRDSSGRLKGKANGHPLVEVQSPKLCQAVFDLYFGDQPVSAKAKKTLGTSFLRLGQPGSYQPPKDRLICDASSACAVAFA